MKIGRVYMLTDHSAPTPTAYIGVTTKPTVNLRLSYHKSDYKRYLNQKYSYCSSFEILKNNNYSIEQVEEFEFESKSHLHAREKAAIAAIGQQNITLVNKNNNFSLK